MLHANPPENAADEFVSYSAMYKRKIQQTKELRYRVFYYSYEIEMHKELII